MSRKTNIKDEVLKIPGEIWFTGVLGIIWGLVFFVHELCVLLGRA